MVRFKIRVEILSKADMADIEKETMNLEKQAKRQTTAKDTIERRRRQSQKRGGIFAGDTGEALPSSIIKRRAKTLTDRLEESKLANQFKSKDKASAQAVNKSTWAKEQEKKIDVIKKGLDETKSKISEISSDIDNPIRLLAKGLSKSKLGLKVLAASAIVTLLTTIILEKVKAIFGPGGPLDVRVLFRAEARTINQLQLLIDIQQGKVFYSSDMRVMSGVVDNSSTQNIGEREERYKEIIIGTDLIG